MAVGHDLRSGSAQFGATSHPIAECLGPGSIGRGYPASSTPESQLLILMLIGGLEPLTPPE